MLAAYYSLARLRQPQPDHGEQRVLCGLPRGMRRHPVEEPRQGGHGEQQAPEPTCVLLRLAVANGCWLSCRYEMHQTTWQHKLCYRAREGLRLLCLRLTFISRPCPAPCAGHRGAAHHARRPAAIWRGESPSCTALSSWHLFGDALPRPLHSSLLHCWRAQQPPACLALACLHPCRAVCCPAWCMH